MIPPFILTFAEGLLGPQFAKFAKPLIWLVAALLLALAAYAVLKIHDHRVVAASQAKVVQRAAPATDQAATERANDTVAITQHEQEQHNAIAAQPDQPIAPTSHVRACDQLRRAGRTPPACR